MQPMYAFLGYLLPKDACFLSGTKTISFLDRWLSPTSPPERSGREKLKRPFSRTDVLSSHYKVVEWSKESAKST
jgi:hypothetical protein